MPDNNRSVPFLVSFLCMCVWKLHIIFCAPFARVSNNVFEWSYFIVECFIVAMYYVQRKKTTRAMIFSITLRFHFHQRKQIITIWTQKRREFRYAFLFLLFLRIFSFYFSTWISSVKKFFFCVSCFESFCCETSSWLFLFHSLGFHWTLIVCMPRIENNTEICLI